MTHYTISCLVWFSRTLHERKIWNILNPLTRRLPCAFLTSYVEMFFQTTLENKRVGKAISQLTFHPPISNSLPKLRLKPNISVASNPVSKWRFCVTVRAMQLLTKIRFIFKAKITPVSLFILVTLHYFIVLTFYIYFISIYSIDLKVAKNYFYSELWVKKIKSKGEERDIFYCSGYTIVVATINVY